MSNTSLYARLAIRQHQLNHAVGLRGYTPQVLSLLELYAKEQQQSIANLLTAALLKGQIDGCQKEIAKLTRQAQRESDIEKQRQLLLQVMGLNRKAQDAMQALQQIEWKQKTTQQGITNRPNGNQQKRQPEGGGNSAATHQDNGKQNDNDNVS